MKDLHPDDDPLLAAALEEFRRAPSGDAPAGVLVSLLEKQAATRRLVVLCAISLVGIFCVLYTFYPHSLQASHFRGCLLHRPCTACTFQRRE